MAIENTRETYKKRTAVSVNIFLEVTHKEKKLLSCNLLNENTHYHPSVLKDTENDSEKKTGLHPMFVDKPVSKELIHQRIESDLFLSENGDLIIEGQPSRELGTLITAIEETSGSTKYNESWPNTEQSFHMDSSVINYNSSSKLNSKEHSIEDFLEQNQGHQNQGTLARFVQRFREQPPKPRKDRDLRNYDNNEGQEFWWLLSPPSSSSTPMSSEPTSLVHASTISPSTPLNVKISKRYKSSSSVLSANETDSETARIQLRANKLLELSETTINSSYSSIPGNPKSVYTPHILMSTSTVNDTYSRHPFNKLSQKYINKDKTKLNVSKPSQKSLKPEDDILYQWRLSRKMELASIAAGKSSDAFLNPHKKVEYPDKNLSTGKPIEKDVNTESVSRKTGVELHESCQRKMNKENELPIETDAKVTSNGTSKYNPYCNSSSSPGSIKENFRKSEQHKQEEGSKRSCKSHRICLHTDCDLVMNITKNRNLCSCTANNQNTGLKENPLAQKGKDISDVPYHTHAICDIRPCCHRKRQHQNTGFQCASNQKLITNSSIPNYREERCNESVPEKETKLPNITNIPVTKEVSSNKNEASRVTPVVSQVVSDRIFRNDVYSANEEAKCPTDEEERLESQRSFLPKGSSSEDEFVDDEILQELRRRRKSTKERLRLVDDALKENNG